MDPYQLLRAAQQPAVGLIALVAVGDIQDDVKRDLAFLADRTGTDCLVLDRGDVGRLLVAHKELCPNDGTWMGGESCVVCGHGARAIRRRPAPDVCRMTLMDAYNSLVGV